MEDGTPSERFERSWIGRVAIAAGIVLFVVAEVVANLPDSAIRRELAPSAERAVRVLGVEQEWGVFAPDPRSSSLGLEATVTFADGTTETWHLPQGRAVVENLRYYRWRKWLERVRSDAYPEIWEPTARWIAGLYDDRPFPVTTVDLVRHFRENTIEDPQPPMQRFRYFTYDVAADAGRTP